MPTPTWSWQTSSEQHTSRSRKLWCCQVHLVVNAPLGACHVVVACSNCCHGWRLNRLGKSLQFLAEHLQSKWKSVSPPQLSVAAIRSTSKAAAQAAAPPSMLVRCLAGRTCLRISQIGAVQYCIVSR